MLNGNHTSLGLWAPSPLHPSLCTFSNFKIEGNALYQLGRCYHLFRLGSCTSVLGALHRLLPPRRSQHKHPSRSQPKLRLQRYHAVSGKQETIDAGSLASMAHLRALNRENSWIGSHLNKESLSLHLKTEQLRAFNGPESRGNPTEACYR